ncbi:heterogeneous nuclear ribonucleoprotein 27C-like isoform X2 [Ornithodoros turicata]|uniref:heterogeneous nuclear ribonucleoprotein 27C-like isoform X2 n=1 Tax=Ornithodoros turicata TaxID=34597 RepID=UPI00313A1F8F
MSRRDPEEQGKIFVGGLSWETTEDGLREYFSQFGDVVDCVVMCSKETGRSRGFGFVTFRDPSCVTLALAGGPHLLDGRSIDPKACNPRSISNGPARMDNSKGAKKGNPCKVFLGGLPAAVTEEELCQFFSEYGKVVEVVIMFDHEQQRSRGFGFLVFEGEDAVSKLTQQRFVQIKDKQVECKRAEPRNARPPPMKRPGGGPWGDGGGPAGGGGPQGWGGSGGPPPPPMNGAPVAPNYQGTWPTPPIAPPAGGYPGYQQWGAPASGFGGYPAMPPAAPNSSQMYAGFGTYNQAASGYGPVRGTGTYGGGYNAAGGYGDGTQAATPASGDASKPASQAYTYHPYQR